MELDDGHRDGGDKKMIKYFTFGKERKRKTKPDGNQGKCIARVLVLVIKTP
jgi:hypothetical protein